MKAPTWPDGTPKSQGNVFDLHLAGAVAESFVREANVKASGEQAGARTAVRIFHVYSKARRGRG